MDIILIWGLGIKNYNEKYKDKLNIHNIIQGEPEENKIINKVCDYLLNLFYGLESDELISENNSDKNQNIFKNEILEFKDDINTNTFQDNEESSDNILYLDEFEPKRNNTYKNKNKKNYNEAFGKDNEIKNFHNSLMFKQ